MSKSLKLSGHEATEALTQGAVLQAKEKLPKISDAKSEKEYGVVRSVSGPVVVAGNMRGVAMYELVRVGNKELLGEVIKIEGDNIRIQVLENTAGLSVGEPVLGTGSPLSVELGPGILNNLFDGIQRPLGVIKELASNPSFIPTGSKISSLDRKRMWEFIPANLKIGDAVSGGDIIGSVYETDLVLHKIMVPPKACGQIIYIAPPGNYSLLDHVLELEYLDEKKKYTMMQTWPVRTSRPCAEKVRADFPLLTGQRVLDSFFPIVQGCSCAIAGAFGCGKSVITQSIAKFSNSDIVVYVGCGERGNELVEPLTDKEFTDMQRTTLVANTSNMPVAAREASIYTGITIAEYFRDQGNNVVMLADSTSRWIEAMREISFSIGELPTEFGNHAHLGARLAQFYERAGKVQCLGSPERTGSIAIVATVSPPGGDFSEPVTSMTLAQVQTFWRLDRELAQRKHFPAVNWSCSMSRYFNFLEPYYEKFDQDLPYLLQKAKTTLLTADDLLENVKIVGMNSITSDTEKLVLEVSKYLREDFLQQDVASTYDKYCPFYKTVWMLRCFMTYYDLAQDAITKEISFAKIVKYTSNIRTKLSQMKFVEPSAGEQENRKFFKAFNEEIEDCFLDLTL